MEFLKQAWHWFLGVPYLKELAINLVAGFIGWLIGKYWGWILRLHHRLKLRRLNKRTAKKHLESIIAFDTVSPCYEEGKAKMRLTGKRFVFEIPEDIRKELEAQTNLDGKPKFAIHEPAKLDENQALYNFLINHYHNEFPDNPREYVTLFTIFFGLQAFPHPESHLPLFFLWISARGAAGKSRVSSPLCERIPKGKARDHELRTVK